MAVSRRSLLAGFGGLATASLLVGCSKNGGSTNASGNSGGSQTDQLNVFYWGAASREALTNKMFALYAKKYPGLSAKGQFLSFDNYFDKLATLAAAGSLPDIIQMNPGSLSQYGEAGQLLDLSTLSLNLGDYQQAALASGQDKGKQYGLAFGYQYVTMFYNASLVKAAGVPVPTGLSNTWDDWTSYCQKLQAKLPSGVFAMTDASSDSNSFESWMVGRGKSLFTTDGKLGYTVQDATDWFDYWTTLRKMGLTSPAADVVTYIQTGDITDSPFTKQKAVLTLGINVGFEGDQMVNKAPLAIAPMPAGTSRRCETNHFFGWSASAKTKDTDAVKKFFEMWFTDVAVIKLLGTDRALPASQSQLQDLKASADPAALKLLNFSIANPDIKPFNPPGTPAVIGSELDDALLRAAEAIVTGKSTAAQAAQAMTTDVEQTLNGG